MILKEIVMASNFEDVYQCLQENNEMCCTVQKEKIETGYNQMRNTATVHDDGDIIIKIMPFEDEDTTYYDVSGYSQREDCQYSLISGEWEEWVSHEVDLDLLAHMTYSEITAHCFWEMTWLGWTIEDRKHNAEVNTRETVQCEALEKIEQRLIETNTVMSDAYLNDLISTYEKAETDHLKTSIEMIIENLIKASLVLAGHIEVILKSFDDEDINEAIKAIFK
jgi:hypothetical protein